MNCPALTIDQLERIVVIAIEHAESANVYAKSKLSEAVHGLSKISSVFEPKACPFCGSSVSYHIWHESAKLDFVTCHGCSAQVESEVPGKAVIVWNRRI